MKNCQNCNNNCEDFMTFCPNCGAKIEETVVEKIAAETVPEDNPEIVEEIVKDTQENAAEPQEISDKTIITIDEETTEITNEIEDIAEKSEEKSDKPHSDIPVLELNTEPVFPTVETDDAKDKVDEEVLGEPVGLPANETAAQPISGVRITTPIGQMPRDNTVPPNMPPQNPPHAQQGGTHQYPAQRNGAQYCPPPQNLTVQDNAHKWNQPDGVPNPGATNPGMPNHGAGQNVNWNQNGGQPQGGQMPPNYPQNGEKGYNVLGIIGIVSGIIGMALFFSIVFPILLGLVAITLGIICLVKSRKKALGVISVVTGVLSLIFTVLFAFIVAFGIFEAVQDNHGIVTEFEQRFNDEFSDKYDDYDDEFRDFGSSDKFRDYLDD